MITNYHTHCNYCDGGKPMEDYIKEAISKGIVAYGISSHAPVNFSCKWTMKPEEANNYSKEIDDLKLKYKNQIQLYKGLEVDFIPEKVGPTHPNIKALGLDYTIGSIHFMDAYEDGTPWQIDDNKHVFSNGLNEIFGGDIQRVVSRYYELTREMIVESAPDIVGHIDKIKRQNAFKPYFSEESTWYKKEVEDTLDLIKTKGVIIEVNTRGYYKGLTDIYPSPWILKEILDRKIPVQVNTDAHVPKEIDLGYAYAIQILQDIGFRSVRVLYDNEWQDISLQSMRT